MKVRVLQESLWPAEDDEFYKHFKAHENMRHLIGQTFEVKRCSINPEYTFIIQDHHKEGLWSDFCEILEDEE